MNPTKKIDDSIVTLARSNTILGGLSPAALERLLGPAQPIEIAPHEVLVSQGARSECAYLILDGDLEVLVETSHGEVLVARLSKGVVIGEIGVFADLPRNATVRALSTVRALRLERVHLLDAGETDPALLRSVIGRLGGQISRVNNVIGLYTNAVAALEQDTFNVGILDELKQPSPELIDFAQHFRRMAEQIVERRTQQAELASAAAIQRAMLPDVKQANLVEQHFDICTHMLPARQVGGDLYDIVGLDRNRVMITIGDVCGKGVPAAIFMAMIQTVMRLVVRSGQDLQAEIESANKMIVEQNKEDMFATLFCGVIDLSSGVMTFCNCGHNPPLLLRHGSTTFEFLRRCGPPLGVAADITYVAQSIALARGDMLLLYTDGVTEAEDPDSAQFGTQRLEHTLLELRDKPAREVIEGVVERVVEFARGAPQSDDITCIAIVRNQTGSSAST